MSSNSTRDVLIEKPAESSLTTKRRCRQNGCDGWVGAIITDASSGSNSSSHVQLIIREGVQQQQQPQQQPLSGVHANQSSSSRAVLRSRFYHPSSSLSHSPTTSLTVKNDHKS